MSGHVLFVEDQDDLRELIADALADVGYLVTVAHDGRDALERLAGPVQFSHVVTDVSMPEGVSGLDVAAEAARIQPQARVVVASGFQRAQLPEIPPGVTFLPKPYRMNQLLAALRAGAAAGNPASG